MRSFVRTNNASERDGSNADPEWLCVVHGRNGRCIIGRVEDETGQPTELTIIRTRVDDSRRHLPAERNRIKEYEGSIKIRCSFELILLDTRASPEIQVHDLRTPSED